MPNRGRADQRSAAAVRDIRTRFLDPGSGIRYWSPLVSVPIMKSENVRKATIKQHVTCKANQHMENV